MAKDIPGPEMDSVNFSYLQSVPITGWFCSVCFEYADVMMSGETLCQGHAKRYKWGYGEQLKAMREEIDGNP